MIPTAEEYYLSYKDKPQDSSMTFQQKMAECMIGFTKLHIQDALEAAVNNAYYDNIGKVGDNDTDSYELDKDSILNSYPLTNIK